MSAKLSAILTISVAFASAASSTEAAGVYTSPGSGQN
jgi:hypothetical protein